MYHSLCFIKVLLIDNLILKLILPMFLLGARNPPQGEMNLDWIGHYFYRLSERAKYSKIINMPDRALGGRLEYPICLSLKQGFF